MTWLALSLGLAAGLFYGLWQRSLAKRYERDWRVVVDDLMEERRSSADARSRYEALIVRLKIEVRRLEEAALANATPGELRARLLALLRPHNP